MLFIEVFFSFLLTIGFAIIFDVKGKAIYHSAIGGALSWLVFRLCQSVDYHYSACYLLATLATALYCEIMANYLKITVPSLLIAGLIPLAPGGGVYYSMLYLFNNQYRLSLLKGTETAIIAGSMALGVVIGMSLSRIFYRFKNFLR